MSKVISMMLVIVIMMVTLAGCGGGGAPAAADTQKIGCESLTSLQTAVGSLATTDANTKLADLKQIMTKVDGPIQAIKTANQMLKLPQIDALTAAYATLAQTIDGLSGDTLGAASAQIQTGAKALDGTLAQASTAMKCGQ